MYGVISKHTWFLYKPTRKTSKISLRVEVPDIGLSCLLSMSTMMHFSPSLLVLSRKEALLQVNHTATQHCPYFLPKYEQIMLCRTECLVKLRNDVVTLADRKWLVSLELLRMQGDTCYHSGHHC